MYVCIFVLCIYVLFICTLYIYVLYVCAVYAMHCMYILYKLILSYYHGRLERTPEAVLRRLDG